MRDSEYMRVDRNTTVALLLGLTVCMTGVACNRSALGPRDVLFDEQGREYDNATAKWALAIYDASSVEEQEKVIGFMTEVLDRRGRGYTRYVAADVLVGLYHNVGKVDQPAKLISRKGFDVLAERVVRLNNGMPVELLSTSFQPSSAIEERLLKVIMPECAMYVGSDYRRLLPGLPVGWEARDAEVTLDGKVLVRRKGVVACVILDLSECLDEKTMKGEHVMKISLDLVGPYGFSKRIEREGRFVVKPPLTLEEREKRIR